MSMKWINKQIKYIEANILECEYVFFRINHFFVFYSEKIE